MKKILTRMAAFVMAIAVLVSFGDVGTVWAKSSSKTVVLYFSPPF